ncbi:hypothetical protein D3C83_148850 [compost metagenome]
MSLSSATICGGAAPPRKVSISSACFVTLLTVPMEPVEHFKASLMLSREIDLSSQRTARRCGRI